MKEWYLTNNYKPTITSGYESDIMSEYAEDNFTDVLDTTFSDIVILYNADLTVSKQVKCVIQGNSADTYLKSMERIGLFPINTVKAGMYILFENRYWLINGYPSSNKCYEKVTMRLCNCKIKWQDAHGKIIERWASAQSSSKYDDGLKEGKTITLTSDNIMLFLPNDDESLTLERKRIFIDKAIPPNKVYIVSRTDSVFYDYGNHGGVLSFITEKTEFNENTDRPDLGICDYVEPIDLTSEDTEIPSQDGDIQGKILGSTQLKVGFKRVYVAELNNGSGDPLEWSERFGWSIIGDSEIISKETNNKIELLVDNEDLVDENFRLILLYDDKVLDEITGVITSLF